MKLDTLLFPIFCLSACVSAQVQDVASDPSSSSASSSSSAPPKYLLHQYPNDSWIENLAVRSNGLILATEASSPRLYSVDPVSGSSSLVYTFPKTQGAVGITETTPDVFYVVVGNFSLSTFVGTKGSFQLWKVDYSSSTTKPAVSKYLDLPGPMFLDGLTTLDAAKGLILGADINSGNVIRIDLAKKTSQVAIDVPLMHPGSNNNIGVDGIKIRNSTLYFTNPGQNVFGKIPIDGSGNSEGSASVVQPIGGDDFAFDQQGDIFTVGGSGNLTEIYGPSLAVMRNLTMLAGPTAAQFGRTAKDSGCLYVTTSGGDGAYAMNPVTVGGAIYGVDVFKNGSCPIANKGS